MAKQVGRRDLRLRGHAAGMAELAAVVILCVLDGFSNLVWAGAVGYVVAIDLPRATGCEYGAPPKAIGPRR